MSGAALNLRRDGFVVLDNLVPEHECGELSSVVRKSPEVGSRTWLEHPLVQRTVRTMRNGQLSQLLEERVAVQCTSFVKTQAKNWSVKLHRDRVVAVKGSGSWKPAGTKEGLECAMPPVGEMARMIAVRLSLDGSPEGDLEVVAGSHKAPQNALDGATTSNVPVRTGGGLIMNPLLGHRSRKLVERNSRMVLHFLFAPRSLPDNYEWYHEV